MITHDSTHRHTKIVTNKYRLDPEFRFVSCIDIRICIFGMAIQFLLFCPAHCGLYCEKLLRISHIIGKDYLFLQRTFSIGSPFKGCNKTAIQYYANTPITIFCCLFQESKLIATLLYRNRNEKYCFRSQHFFLS